MFLDIREWDSIGALVEYESESYKINQQTETKSEWMKAYSN